MSSLRAIHTLSGHRQRKKPVAATWAIKYELCRRVWGVVTTLMGRFPGSFGSGMSKWELKVEGGVL